MMRSLATVVTVGKNELTVSCQQQTTCGSCAAQSSCGTGIVTKAIPGRSHLVKLDTKTRAQVGDVVEIGLSERSMLHSAMLVYLLPLLFLVLGAVLGQWWFVSLSGGSELGVILTALISGAAGLLLARNLAARLEGRLAYKPSLVRVLGNPISADQVINGASKDSD
ncbi:SoxR reducing system RseC family protein [Photobacterium minamisatsumaniensis]|uniref:SoxR reducing system RseC family protein n=1 Tax=Photobacterium minamisatsumaniensis TaxID=2910233 RepID=UPI003D0C0433